MTITGQGVPTANIIEGMKLLKEVENSSPEALLYLGFCALEGVGQRINDDEAFKYYTKAAGQGHPEGIMNLAYLHLLGRGTKKNMYEASNGFKMAADYGNPVAQVHAGMMARDGVGGPKNPQEAKNWFERASGSGHPLGKYALADLMLKSSNTDWMEITDLFIAASSTGNVRGLVTESIYIDTLARVLSNYNSD